MAAKCGRCGQRHETVAEIRECYNRALPERTPVPGSLRRDRATDKQVRFAGSLLAKLGRDESSLPKPLDEYGVREISPLIDQLQDDIRNADPAQLSHAEVLEDGMYRTAEGIFKVQHAIHGSRQQYAKKLVVVAEATFDDEGDMVAAGTIRFDYAPGSIRKLTPKDRMTLEEAVEFGALYGTCVRCGRTLTKEKSIERSMGPVCAGKI